MMNIKVISLGFIMLLFILIVGCKQDSTLFSEKHTGNTLVTFDGGKITSGDLANFLKYRQDSMSDNQALEMIIERELLYKEAQAQGLTATLKEAKAESDKQKSTYEQYGTEQDKKELQAVLNELNISEKEYWNNYSPKAYRKSITIASMKKSVKDKIYADVIENHSDWGQTEIEKEFDESYSKAINDLKTKYNLQYAGS